MNSNANGNCFKRWGANVWRSIQSRFELPAIFKLSKREHWVESGNWLIYTLFGGLLPFWGTALILLFVNRSQPFQAYFSNGELAVFCAGLLASAMPVMRRRVKDAPIEHPEWFHFVALICLAIILVLFASVTLARHLSLPGTEGAPVNTGAILWASFALFGVSVLVCFFVELINNVRMTPSVVKEFDAQRQSQLESDFAIRQEEQND